MSNSTLKDVLLRVALPSLFAVPLVVCGLFAAHAQDEPHPGRILVRNSLSKNLLGSRGVLVEIYYHGKVVRSTELGVNNGNSGLEQGATWDRLVPGEYEVHFSSRGFGEFVKLITVSPDNDTEVSVEVEKSTVTMGRNISIEDLERRITALENRGR